MPGKGRPFAVGDGRERRRKGIPNKITRAFREAVLSVYDGLGGSKAMLAWAKKHPSQFYLIAARLIPHEVSVDLKATMQTTVIHKYEP